MRRFSKTKRDVAKRRDGTKRGSVSGDDVAARERRETSGERRIGRETAVWLETYAQTHHVFKYVFKDASLLARRLNDDDVLRTYA